MSEPSASRTREYREKIDIPGPIAACAKSTGATAPNIIARRVEVTRQVVVAHRLQQRDAEVVIVAGRATGSEQV
jgi:hypothetical protein